MKHSKIHHIKRKPTMNIYEQTDMIEKESDLAAMHLIKHKCNALADVRAVVRNADKLRDALRTVHKCIHEYNRMSDAYDEQQRA